MSDDLLRLSKLMSQKGLCSRREADKLIAMGLVRVNGQIIDQLGAKVKPTDQVELLQKGQEIMSEKITLILSKPIGYVSSQPEKDYQSAMTLLQPKARILTSNKEKLKLDMKGLAPAGRLDIDSKGLIIYTQDGVVAKKIIGEDSRIDKEYVVQFEGAINNKKLQKLRHGLSLDNQKLCPALVTQEDDHTLIMTLNQGRKRQIRRMLELVDLKVTHLKRVRIGPIELEDLKEGTWRILTASEISGICNYIGHRALTHQ